MRATSTWGRNRLLAGSPPSRRERPRHLLQAAASLAVGLQLVACSGGSGSSGTSAAPSSSGSNGVATSGSPGLGLADRVRTAQVCAAVSSDVATVVEVGVQLAAQSTTPAEARTKLAPTLAKVTAAAAQHAALPVGRSLQHLADTITTASQVDPTGVSSVRSAAGSLGNAGKDVLTTCAAAAR